MDFQCDSIIKVVLPAVRVSMAEEMRSRYNLNQQRIAKILGIAQVAVSKYLNGRYSSEVRRASEYIKKNGLVDDIAKKAAGKSNPEEIDRMISDLCAKIASI